MPDIPSNIFDNLPLAEEEPKASIGERYKQYQAAKRSDRGAPSLQKWYSKAIGKRRDIAPSQREMGFAPVMTAMNAMEEESKNTRTIYPYGGFDRHFVERQMTGAPDAPAGGTGLEQEFYDRKTTELVGSMGSGEAVLLNPSAYSDTVVDNYTKKLKEEMMFDWTPETTNEEGIKVNWKGEELPPRASGWGADNETPYYGTDWKAPWRKLQDSLDLLFERSESLRAPVEGETDEERAGRTMRAEIGGGIPGALAFNTAIAETSEHFITKPTERQLAGYSIAYQLMAEAGEPLLWQKVGEKAGERDEGLIADYEARHGYPPPSTVWDTNKKDNWWNDFWDRAKLGKFFGNIVLANARIANGDIKLSEVKEYVQRGKEIARMGWSIAYQDRGAIEEFEQRVRGGENPDMVALDMEQPFSEALGRAVMNPTNVAMPLLRFMKGVATTEAAFAFANTPADEIGVVFAKYGDDLFVIKDATRAVVARISGGEIKAGEIVFGAAEEAVTAANLTDDLMIAYRAASSRIMSGINASQSTFGPWANTGISKINNSVKLSTEVLEGLGQNLKNADDIADVVLNLAKLQSSDPEQFRAASLMLNEQLQVPHLAYTPQAIETSILLADFLKDADGVIQPDKLVADMKLAIREGNDPLRVAINRTELAASNIYPTERAIIDAERAWKENPYAKNSPAVQRFFDNGGELGFVDRFNALRTEKGLTLGGVYGAIHRAQKAVSSIFYVGANFPVALRGALYDAVMSGIIAGNDIHLHPSEYWANVATDILGYEHAGLTQTFGHEEASGMASWKASTGNYKDRGSLLQTVANAGEGMSLETALNFGGRALQYTEQTNSMKIIGYSVQKAVGDMVEKCLPDTSELVGAGLSQDIVNGLPQIVMNNNANPDKYEAEIMSYISGEEPIYEKDLFKWVDKKTKATLERLGIWNEAKRIVKDSDTFEEASEMIGMMLEGQLALEKSITQHFPTPQIDPIVKEKDIGFIQDAAFEAATDIVEGQPNLDIDMLNDANSKVQANTNTVDAVDNAINFMKEEISRLLRHSKMTKEEINNIIDDVIAPQFARIGNPVEAFNKATGVNRNETTLAQDFGHQLMESDGKKELAEIWAEMQKDLNIPGDVPRNKWLAKDKMWTTVFSRNVRAFQESRILAVREFNDLLENVVENLGGDTVIARTIADAAEVKAVALNENIAIRIDNSVMVDGELKPVGDIISGHVGMGDNANASRAIASYMNPSYGVFRADSEAFDTDIIRVASHMSGELFESIDDIPPEIVFDAYNKYRVMVLEVEPMLNTFDEIVGYKPEVRVPEAIEPQSIVNKYNLVGDIDDTELRHLVEFLNEHDYLRVNEILLIEDEEEALGKLTEFADEVIKELKDNPTPDARVMTEYGWAKPGEDLTPESSITSKEFPITKSEVIDGNLVEETRMISSEVKDFVSPDIDAPLNYEQIESLTIQMKKSGWDERQWPPIEITVQPNGNRIVTDGQHRAIAASTARLSDVPVRITTMPQLEIVEGQKLIDDVRPIIPPHDGSSDISIGRDVHEQKNLLEAAVRKFKAGMKKVWNKKEYANVTPGAKRAAKSFFEELRERLVVIKQAAAHYAQQTRDRILYDYANRYGLDGTVSSFRNFHFWPTRTAAAWGKRLPFYLDYVQAYLNYREAMDKYHADRPKWLRQSWSTNEIFGLDADNPIYLSLAGILDVYQNLVGGFEDEDRRATWFSTIFDKINTVVPGGMGMIQQFVMAAGLKAIGEDEAAGKWAGRSIPVTQTIKGLTSILGINEGRGIDLDPSILAFSQNNTWNDYISGRSMGPYEEKRIAVAMGYLISKYPNMPEELLDQARAHEGPLWDEATKMIAEQGAIGNVVSFFTGINARARSKDDLVVSQFWQEYIYLMTQYDTTNPVSWRNKRQELMDKYPFAETMLLARKGTEERNISYGYAVLSRIAPGETDEIAKAAGFKYDILAYFYENKGDVSDLPQEDQNKLWTFFAEAGASIAIPDKATKGEWTDASNAYAKMITEMEELFGDKIVEKIDAGYNLKGESLNSRDDWYDYLEQFPEVQEASRWKAEYIIQHPTMSAYYGSIDRLRNFWKGDMYQKLEDEFGSEIWDTQTRYFIYTDTGQDDKAKAWKKAHPELQEYWDMKNKVYTPQIVEAMAVYGEKLPEGQDARLRQDFVEETASTGAVDIAEYIQSPDLKTYTKDEWVSMLGPQTVEMALYAWEDIVNDQNGADIIEYLRDQAGLFGMSYEEFIISIGGAE